MACLENGFGKHIRGVTTLMQQLWKNIEALETP